MNLIIGSRTIEIEEYNLHVNFNPYSKAMQCKIANSTDIDELGEFLDANYQGSFTLDETEYTNYPGLSINLYDNGQETKTNISFNTISDEKE